MITLRRSLERRHVRRGKQDRWLAFHPDKPPGPCAHDFGVLAAFDEIRLSPGGVAGAVCREDAEIVTYVYKGALAQEDSAGNSGVVHAGEFQVMTAGNGIRRKETNASRTDGVQVFRISLRPSQAGLDQAQEQKRFSAAQRRNALCVIASPDGRKGSLRTRQDTLVYSSILDPGHHIVHALLPNRSAWLHIVRGEGEMNDIILTQGDAVGVAAEPSISLTVQENAEILLVDLGPAPWSVGSGVVS